LKKGISAIGQKGKFWDMKKRTCSGGYVS
jgi:hypothetical protein